MVLELCDGNDNDDSDDDAGDDGRREAGNVADLPLGNAVWLICIWNAVWFIFVAGVLTYICATLLHHSDTSHIYHTRNIKAHTTEAIETRPYHSGHTQTQTASTHSRRR